MENFQILSMPLRRPMKNAYYTTPSFSFFTDNRRVEAAFYNGTFTSRKLFELIVRLQGLQMHGDMALHFIHVVGKQMMDQGTDGLSRGSLCEGIMQGKDPLRYIPLNKSVMERQPHPLRAWV